MAGSTGVTIRVVSNRLPQIAAGLRPGVAEDVATTAYEIQAEAQRLAAVKTGTMRRSIHTLFSNGGLTAIVGPSVLYAKFVEWGTRFRAARPFMRPAAERFLPRLIPRIKTRLSRAA